MSSGGKKPDRPPQERSQPAQKTTTAGPSRAVRILVSIVLAFHVFVLFLYPLNNSRSSATVASIAQWPGLRWYADPLYLNNGYGFFGPDPGPGMLIDYQVFDNSGEVIAEGRFPDAERIWPRLRYHRYKMLADQLDSPQFSPADNEARKRYMLERYAQHLIRKYDGQSATVEQVMHELVRHHEWLGDDEQGIPPKTLDDKSTYRTLMQVRQTRADVERSDARLLTSAEGTGESVGEPVSLPEPISPGRTR